MNFESMTEQQLLDVVTTPEWMWELLRNSSAQQHRDEHLAWLQFNYIQQHYQDECELQCWSCDEISADQLLMPHPWPYARYIEHGNIDLKYRDQHKVKIQGPLWIDIWVAASRVMQIDDGDHRFIEGFATFDSTEDTIEVWTGS
jgi:hypothetical protein